ncbi:hypothetical protein M0G43_00125 [Subsaxibacter sp. CAU 1640]|uniref:hypothetical protein n=1 Tax=Subsaxibacter sp. CAU 1640 TaxID=2933271 RepID=UPI0020062A65|nr:hypothetical protein [Subsaxibacter sp. CAU 1640]MCK7588969.1 hypothetical protein [Subsaxibacter sp. CAU 1640]
MSYIVPISALLVIGIQFLLIKHYKLNPWKGGGFGMYSQIHYYYNDLIINDLKKPFDSIIKQDRQVASFVMDVKRTPNKNNLKHMAELVSQYAKRDSITIQIWKPSVNAETSSYTRELLIEYQFVKP